MSEQSKAQELRDVNVWVSLTDFKLDTASVISSVKSPKAGAVVLFAGTPRPTMISAPSLIWLLGTTRDNFDGKPVAHLEYSSYAPLALKTMLSIAQSVKEKHALTAVAMVHRLGVVPIEEESILIAVSAPHRQAAWKGGEEALELCKEKVEIWKLEEFGGDEGGVWRANRDGKRGVPVDHLDAGRSHG
ncbi:MAG: hypothetical protein LQ345_006982 [Seirophora villosa]|nr:MAG: hypothetical protein LQ345_006982 [Seirophora villosa]